MIKIDYENCFDVNLNESNDDTTIKKKTKTENVNSIFERTTNGATNPLVDDSSNRPIDTITMKPTVPTESSNTVNTENSEKTNTDKNEQINFNKLREYLQNGHTAKETYEYLINDLKNNKDNHDYVRSVIDNLLKNFSPKYDHNVPYMPVAETREEALEKFLKAEKGEYVEGAICATMHGLAKDILKDIGIPAVLVSSKVYTNKQKSSYGGHITLLYKLEDNKYVSTDYGNSNIIEADNIKAATQKLYKESNHLTGERGYIFLLGDEGQSYTEYMFQNESSYGEDIEKGNHVRESAFIKDNAKKKNAVEIKADYANTSNRKNFEIKNTVAIPKANLSIDMGASSRATDETNVLMESGSYGAMAGVAYDKKFGKKKSNRVKANADGRISRLKGKTEKNEYQVETLKNSFNLGYEHDFFNNGNTIISGGLKLSGIGSRTVDKVRNKDMRISAEAGLELKTHLGKIGYFDAEISGGAIGDYGKLQYTYQDRGFIPGFKTNLKTALTLQPSCDFSAKIDAQGYYLKSRTTEHYGVSGGVMGMLKLSDYIDLYGAIEMDYDNKNISLGLLEENIDKTSSVSSTLGVKINKNTDISINVTKGLKSDDYSTQLMFKKEF